MKLELSIGDNKKIYFSIGLSEAPHWFGIYQDWTSKVDYAGFTLRVILFFLSFEFGIVDKRQWDSETDDWITEKKLAELEDMRRISNIDEDEELSSADIDKLIKFNLNLNSRKEV